MTDITVILPIHDVSGDFDTWFNKSIKSVVNQVVKPTKLLIVRASSEEIDNYFNTWETPEGLNVEIIENKGETDFCSQINFGVENSTTEWFSILEYDDEYSNIWFKNFEKYSEYHDDVSIFFPLVVDTDENGQFIGFTNEALWAMSFSEELGFLDNNTLLQYQNFQVSGMAMRVETFKEIGGLKPSVKLTFNYEFLLRATYNDVRVMTIPKVGYKHTNMRESSLFWDYKFNPLSKLTPEEAKFWVETSKKEYFFADDRNVEYKANNEFVGALGN